MAAAGRLPPESDTDLPQKNNRHALSSYHLLSSHTDGRLELYDIAGATIQNLYSASDRQCNCKQTGSVSGIFGMETTTPNGT